MGAIAKPSNTFTYQENARPATELAVESVTPTAVDVIVPDPRIVTV